MARVAGYEEDVIRFVDEAVQVRCVPHERVVGLTPEPRLVSLVVAATISSQGGYFVDVVVSRRSGGFRLHAFILIGERIAASSRSSAAADPAIRRRA